MAALEVDPELRIHSEKHSQRERHFRADWPLAFDDLVHRGARYARAAGKLALAELVGIQEFLLEQASGSGCQNGFLFAGHGGGGLVIIGDFNIEGTALAPTEAEPPLVVDADAVLADTASPEGLQPVAGRNAQNVEIGGGIQ